MSDEKNNAGFGNSGHRNSGDGNSGNCNSGYGNSGNRNSGNRNSGGANSGYGNSGGGNSGDGNSGFGNSGDRNSGDRNSGGANSGYGNSGGGNSGDWNSGYFNTDEPKLRLFNRDSEFTRSELIEKNITPHWKEFFLTKWIPELEMTDAEKQSEPQFIVRGGYLKRYSYKEAWAIFWKDTDEPNRQKFLNLPNFDATIFEEITGINVKKISCDGEIVEIKGQKYKLTKV